MTITVQEAKSLAIRYHAYHEACTSGDLRGIIVWGDMLLESQAFTGVRICDSQVLRQRVENARAYRRVLEREGGTRR